MVFGWKIFIIDIRSERNHILLLFIFSTKTIAISNGACAFAIFNGIIKDKHLKDYDFPLFKSNAKKLFGH